MACVGSSQADLDPRLLPLSKQCELELRSGFRSRRQATRAACRWSSSRRVGVRSSSAVTWRFASASSTTRATEGQLRVRALDPELVWLTHEHEPWRPSTV